MSIFLSLQKNDPMLAAELHHQKKRGMLFWLAPIIAVNGMKVVNHVACKKVIMTLLEVEL